MKRSLHKILFFLIAVLILPLFSLTAGADDLAPELKSLHFDIVLQEDGSALITETREIEFYGDQEYTRYGVRNYFTGPRVFCDWQVSIDGVSLSHLDEPDNETRPENTFAVEDTEEGNTLYIYYRQYGSGTRIFQISYCVENAVKLYSDVGEFHWNLTSETDISNIDILTATLTVPEGIPEEDFRIWAHGPLNGTFEKQSVNTAALHVEDIYLGTIVDIRSTLPADIFYGGWEQQGEALPDILAKEKELTDSANAKREEEERRKAENEAYWAKRYEWEEKHPILYFLEYYCEDICYWVEDFLEEHGIALVLFTLLSIPVLWLTGVVRIMGKCWNWFIKKRYKKHPTQSPQYSTNPPGEWPAPVVDRLVHFYEGYPNASRQISAALMELSLKGLIHFQTTEDSTEIILNEQLGEETFPHPMSLENAEQNQAQENVESDQTQEHIPGYQEILWDYLLKVADGSGKVSMSNLKTYSDDRENYDTVSKFRNSFKDAVEREYTEWVKSKDEQRYFPGFGKFRWLLPGISGILTMLIIVFSSLYYGIEPVPTLLCGIIAFVAVFIIQGVISILIKMMQFPCILLEQQSEDDLALWQAFGRYLDDFTTLNNIEIPDISLWRDYMPYAIALGRGKNVANALALKYPQDYSSGRNDCSEEMFEWLRNQELYDEMDSISRSVVNASLYTSRGNSSGSSNDWSDNSNAWSDNSSDWSDSGSNWSDSDGGGGGFSDSGGGSDSGSGGSFID